MAFHVAVCGSTTLVVRNILRVHTLAAFGYFVPRSSDNRNIVLSLGEFPDRHRASEKSFEYPRDGLPLLFQPPTIVV